MKDKIANDIKVFTEKLVGMRYAKSTIRQYRSIAYNFLTKVDDPRRLPTAGIQEYINRYDGSGVTMGQIRGTLENLYRWVYDQPRKFNTIPYPKKEHKLPVWLTIQETYALISCIKNTKQRALVQLSYSCALRVSEAVSVKVTDISDGFLTVRKGKGGKDRQIPIPDETLLLLRSHFKKNRPVKYLFEGQDKNSPYSTRSMQAVVRRAAHRVGIKKKVTVHTLRHSRATHWYNNSMPLLTIKELLGHSHISTTEIYTHIGQDDFKNMVFLVDQRIKQKAETLENKKDNHLFIGN